MHLNFQDREINWSSLFTLHSSIISFIDSSNKRFSSKSMTKTYTHSALKLMCIEASSYIISSMLTYAWNIYMLWLQVPSYCQNGANSVERLYSRVLSCSSNSHRFLHLLYLWLLSLRYWTIELEALIEQKAIQIVIIIIIIIIIIIVKWFLSANEFLHHLDTRKLIQQVVLKFLFIR